MSTFDLSRLLYVHPTCGKLPCICVREHKPLDVLELTCQECGYTALTASEMQNHSLDNHEVPLVGKEVQ